MNILRSKYILTAIVCLWSNMLLALTTEDYFPDQERIYTAKNPDFAYRLALSSLKKINGEWEAEKETLVRGKLTRATIEISRPYNLKTALLEMESQFEGINATLVYACENMGCGSSNAWANERFGVKQLYGLDLSQYYQVWQYKHQGLNTLAVIYLVERGNKRVYSQIDIIIPKDQNIAFAPSAEVIAETFYRDKQIAIRGLSFEQGNIQINKEYLKSYVRAFNQQAFRKLIVVGYDYHPGSEDDQKTRADAHALAVKQALVTLGVQERRLEVKRAEALAPVAKNSAEKGANQELKGRVVVKLR